MHAFTVQVANGRCSIERGIRGEPFRSTNHFGELTVGQTRYPVWGPPGSRIDRMERVTLSQLVALDGSGTICEPTVIRPIGAKDDDPTGDWILFHITVISPGGTPSTGGGERLGYDGSDGELDEFDLANSIYCTIAEDGTAALLACQDYACRSDAPLEVTVGQRSLRIGIDEHGQSSVEWSDIK